MAMWVQHAVKYLTLLLPVQLTDFYSVVVDREHVQTPWIPPQALLVPALMMFLMCLVLCKKDGSVSPSQDLLTPVSFSSHMRSSEINLVHFL